MGKPKRVSKKEAPSGEETTRERRATSTSSHGVSRRENHDASSFYARFEPPVMSTATDVDDRKAIDGIFVGDARNMRQVPDNSVALVVTSPPYFVGKEYEQAVGVGHVPANYVSYLEMLEDVFAECVRKLEPGGRIAVNVANLGRRPYRSLSADIIEILQNRLRLLLRGEVIWQKARGAGGSCAWGSFQRPANPVLRDLTERIVIASKGRFDRALSASERHRRGLPSEASISRDEFMEATTDVWEMAPESASRVGHPAPFPVELPERLIYLYTYSGDLVLDPFSGSGTTAVAALRTERHYAGYDTEERYVKAAKHRLEEERERIRSRQQGAKSVPKVALAAVPPPGDPDEHFQTRAGREGRAAKELAELVLTKAGFQTLRRDLRFPEGVEINFEARDQLGKPWFFDVSGGFTSSRPGLRRTDTLWKALGKAAVLHEVHPSVPLVLLTTHVPSGGRAGEAALAVLSGAGKPIYDVIELLDEAAFGRLCSYAAGDASR